MSHSEMSQGEVAVVLTGDSWSTQCWLSQELGQHFNILSTKAVYRPVQSRWLNPNQWFVLTAKELALGQENWFHSGSNTLLTSSVVCKANWIFVSIGVKMKPRWSTGETTGLLVFTGVGHCWCCDGAGKSETFSEMCKVPCGSVVATWKGKLVLQTYTTLNQPLNQVHLSPN